MKETQKPKLADYNDHFVAVLTESLFVLLPLIVLTIVFLHKGRSLFDLAASPEWSFGGAVFMGQTVVKLVYGISSVRGVKPRSELIGFVVAGSIVLGLVPSLIVLSLLLTSESPTTGMVRSQLILFFLGLVLFLFFGTLAHKEISENLSKDEA